MADFPYGGPTGAVEPDQAPIQSSRAQGSDTLQTLGTVTNWAGAAVSLALIVGIGVWGYKMLSRDVSGVPIVRVASGDPMRVQPVDPGGSPAMHQGLAVNQVAAEGAAERPADRLVLAPAPVSLDDEDMAGAAAQVASAPVTDDEPAPAAVPAVVAETPQMASIRALADQLTGGTAPLDEVAPAPDATPETIQSVAAVAPVVTTPKKPDTPTAKPDVKPTKAVVKGGIKKSLRPTVRPDGLKKAAAVVPAASALEIDPSDIPAGTKLAQLGAFDSAETARKEWNKLSNRFGDYLEGKQRVIQKAKSGGRVFYRLRAMGFADLSDARRFCSALVAERADCIPVTTK
ncbi:SPOR domain-containing protein [Alisedimentitalea sp. MJ-SS2]|uniref:SPOR domain-containing protein n=1 Tax=Aliisedimentitalea sp. MJ-SS2 TaxID=3049795 RepID=UPI0029074566|nr:SPOR domain-containing protein [Alisedimentitalea sp. MJ-SS2]MDU8926794.1 SPOR domain-containing protein [Alisedimentitalea sp. MJ-SS2]